MRRSLFRLVTASVAACSYGALYITTRSNLAEHREFEPYTTNYAIMESLQTGDVVLFNSNFITANLWKMLLIFFSKQVNQSDFDHIGVIVKPIDDVPYILEHTFARVHLTPFEARVLHSRSNGIMVRRLECQRSPEILKRAEEWAYEQARSSVSVTPAGLLSRLLSLFIAQFDSTVPCNLSRVDDYGILLTQQSELQTLGNKISKARAEHEVTLERNDAVLYASPDAKLPESANMHESLRSKLIKYRTQEYAVKKSEKNLEKMTKTLKAEQSHHKFFTSPFPNAALVAGFFAEMAVIPTLGDLPVPLSPGPKFSTAVAAPDSEIAKPSQIVLSEKEFKPINFSDSHTLPLIDATLTRPFHIKTEHKPLKYLVFEY